jgi:hypothetical protein
VLKDGSPLIREQFNKDNPFTINAPSFVSQKAIEYIIDETLKKAGVRKPGLIHLSHGFRKFFVSQCESTPMKSVHVSLSAMISASSNTTTLQRNGNCPVWYRCRLYFRYGSALSNELRGDTYDTLSFK